MVVLIFSQNFSTNGPYLVLKFLQVSDTMVLFFAKKSYTTGKFTGETEKSAFSEEVAEFGMKSTKMFNLALAELLKSLVYQVSWSLISERLELVVLNFSKL